MNPARCSLWVTGDICITNMMIAKSKHNRSLINRQLYAVQSIFLSPLIFKWQALWSDTSTCTTAAKGSHHLLFVILWPASITSSGTWVTVRHSFKEDLDRPSVPAWVSNLTVYLLLDPTYWKPLAQAGKWTTDLRVASKLGDRVKAPSCLKICTPIPYIYPWKEWTTTFAFSSKGQHITEL